MLKKSIFILFAAVLVLSLAGSATATKPAPVTCELFWMNGNYDFTIWPVERKMAYNETAQLYNVDESVPLLDSNVRLGILNFRSADGTLDTYALNPEEETYIQITWFTTLVEELRSLRDMLTMQLVIDGGEPSTIYPGPVVNLCSNTSDGAFEREWGYVR